MTTEADQAKALYDEGVAAFRAGDDQTSRQRNDAAIEIGRRTGDAATMVRGLIGLSRLAFRAGDHDELVRLCREAEPFWLSMEDTTTVPSPIHMIAESLRGRGELEAARPLYRESIRIARDGDDLEWVALELNNLAFLELQAEDADAADACSAESVQTHHPEGMMVAYALLAKGAIAALRGDGGRAAHCLAAAQTMVSESGTVFDPADQTIYDAALRRLDALLPEHERTAAWNDGCALGQKDRESLLKH